MTCERPPTSASEGRGRADGRGGSVLPVGVVDRLRHAVDDVDLFDVIVGEGVDVEIVAAELGDLGVVVAVRDHVVPVAVALLGGGRRWMRRLSGKPWKLLLRRAGHLGGDEGGPTRICLRPSRRR